MPACRRADPRADRATRSRCRTGNVSVAGGRDPPDAGSAIVGKAFSSFGVNIVMLLFVLYFMLIGGTRMETYCRGHAAVQCRRTARSATREIYMIVRSNAIGIPLLAVVPGRRWPTSGYLVCGVSSARCSGECVHLLRRRSCPSSARRSCGLPLAALSSRTGGQAGAPGIGLAAYGGLVVTQIGQRRCGWSFCRRRMADTHPLVTISRGASSACRFSGSWASSSGRCCWRCSFSASISSSARISTAGPTVSFPLPDDGPEHRGGFSDVSSR